MKKEKSVFKNYIYNLSYQMLAVIIPLVVTPHVSRALSAEGIGVYSYTYSIAYYFYIIGNLGISTYGQLEVAKYRDDKEKCSRIFWEICLARACTVLISLIAYIVLIGFNREYRDAYIALILYLVSGALEISWFFQGLEEFKLTVMRNMIIKIVSTILILVLVNEKNDLILYIVILYGSTLFGNISLWPYLNKYITKCKVMLSDLPGHWKLSFVYFIPTVASSVYHVLDKSLIGVITNSAYENGCYEQAHKIEQVLLTVIVSLATVTVPRIANLNSKGEKKQIRHICTETLEFVMLLSVPMMIGLIIIAPDFVPLFLGDGYEESVILLQLFSVLFVVVGLSNTAGKQCLIAVGRQKNFNISIIASAAVNVILNIILINLFAAVGATIASIVAEIVALCLTIYYSKDLINCKELMLSMSKYMILGIVMGLIIFIVSKAYSLGPLLKVIIQIAIGCSIYFAALIMIKDKIVLKYVNKLLDKIRHRKKR